MVMLSSGKLDLKPNVILFNNIVFSLRLKTHEVFISKWNVSYAVFVYNAIFLHIYISIPIPLYEYKITICFLHILVTKWSWVY